MRFSIRALLAFGMLVALGMLLARTLNQAARDHERIAELTAVIRSLESSMRFDEPSLHQAILHSADGDTQVRILRDRAVEHFAELQTRYSTLNSAGRDVVALRGIPMLRNKVGHAPLVYRIIIPEGRHAWLKFGVHVVDDKSPTQNTLDKGLDLLTESQFEDSGPFEFRMEPGDQEISIEIGPVEQELNRVPLVISINDRDLLRTAFVSDDRPVPNWISLSGLTQLDFPPDRPLPWLMTTTMAPQWPKSERPPVNHGFSVWLSDHASGFVRFSDE